MIMPTCLDALASIILPTSGERLRHRELAR
jgi:hypothetical protein